MQAQRPPPVLTKTNVREQSAILITEWLKSTLAVQGPMGCSKRNCECASVSEGLADFYSLSFPSRIQLGYRFLLDPMES